MTDEEMRQKWLREIRERLECGRHSASGSPEMGDIQFLLFEYDRLAALLAEAEALLRDAAAHGELEQYRAGFRKGMWIIVESMRRAEVMPAQIYGEGVVRSIFAHLCEHVKELADAVESE